MNAPPARPPGGPPKPPPRRPPPSPAAEANPFMDAPDAARTAEEAPNPFFDPPARSGGVVTSAPPLLPTTPELDSAPLRDAPLPLDIPGVAQPVPPAAARPAAPSPRAAPSPPSPSAGGFAAPQAPAHAQVQAAAPQPQGAPLQVQPGAVAPNIGDPHAEFRRGSFKKVAIFLAAAGLCGVGLFYGLPESEPTSPVAPANTDLRANAVIGASVSPEIIEDPNATSATSPRKEPAQASADEESPSASRPSDSQGNFANSFKTLAK